MAGVEAKGVEPSIARSVRLLAALLAKAPAGPYFQRHSQASAHAGGSYSDTHCMPVGQTP